MKSVNLTGGCFMRDPRLERLAGLMLNHSMKIKRGEAFHISADVVGLPLVKAILRQAAAWVLWLRSN